ncbi:soluble lytic murein transglycosylase [Caminicella sporogenes DSM 14501]|uniref:Soluble lytic murein transglycosylase n=1 Tax=Caminicella sporogenes DSM 14501 TaxID=1121266 RepID=A0A1M6LYB2_9FIRM|nr:lytic transglycosylase domain-containing protein [Caminicella sporogenes]SHJ76237.1 soluble lytic murein transglycosylase [Caminicella sporogenes DSM 14501]
MKVIDLRRYRLIFILFIIVLSLQILLVSVKFTLKMVYPFHYRHLIEKYSREYNLDPLLVAAIIKVESKFNEKAVSIKGAKGLMQISSITGKWASEELKIENYTEEMLFNPDINIKIGCWYLNLLNKQFNNNLSLVLAAYNGGSGNVSKWLKDIRYSEDGINLKNIPFVETKGYVKKVHKSFKIYRYLYKDI